MSLEDNLSHELENTIEEKRADYEFYHENRKLWGKFPKAALWCFAYFGLRTLTGHLFGGAVQANGDVIEGSFSEGITHFIDYGVYSGIWLTSGLYALLGSYSGIKEHFAKKSLEEAEEQFKNMNLVRF